MNCNAISGSLSLQNLISFIAMSDRQTERVSRRNCEPNGIAHVYHFGITRQTRKDIKNRATIDTDRFVHLGKLNLPMVVKSIFSTAPAASKNDASLKSGQH